MNSFETEKTTHPQIHWDHNKYAILAFHLPYPWKSFVVKFVHDLPHIDFMQRYVYAHLHTYTGCSISFWPALFVPSFLPSSSFSSICYVCIDWIVWLVSLSFFSLSLFSSEILFYYAIVYAGLVCGLCIDMCVLLKWFEYFGVSFLLLRSYGVVARETNL